jgi:hypothetical protein
MATSGGQHILGPTSRTRWRRTLLCASAVVASLSVIGCGSHGATTATASSSAAAAIIYGPPRAAADGGALGTVAEGVLSLRFAVDGRHYLVRTGPQPVFRPSQDPARSGSAELADHTPVTLTCQGSISTASAGGSGDGTSEAPTVAGPLTVMWQEGGQFFTLLSQDDTDPCAPSASNAAALLRMIGSLRRLSAVEWNQLVSEHPILLTGDSSDQGSTTGQTGGG